MKDKKVIKKRNKVSWGFPFKKEGYMKQMQNNRQYMKKRVQIKSLDQSETYEYNLFDLKFLPQSSVHYGRKWKKTQTK